MPEEATARRIRQARETQAALALIAADRSRESIAALHRLHARHLRENGDLGAEQRQTLEPSAFSHRRYLPKITRRSDHHPNSGSAREQPAWNIHAVIAGQENRFVYSAADEVHPSRMRTLMIEAASVKSAQDIEATLLGFERELVADDGRYFVHVTLPAGDRGITAAVGVLDALQTYASEQGTSARMILDGQSYTVEVPPPVAPPVVAPPLDV